MPWPQAQLGRRARSPPLEATGRLDALPPRVAIPRLATLTTTLRAAALRATSLRAPDVVAQRLRRALPPAAAAAAAAS
eukprot:COSAG04_NODE_195_length_20819_cov_5.821718_1_plen_77_part_10